MLFIVSYLEDFEFEGGCVGREIMETCWKNFEKIRGNVRLSLSLVSAIGSDSGRRENC